MKSNILSAIFKDLYTKLKSENKSITRLNDHSEEDVIKIYVTKKEKDNI